MKRKKEIEKELKEYSMDYPKVNRFKLTHIIWKDEELMEIMEFMKLYGYSSGFKDALKWVLK